MPAGFRTLAGHGIAGALAPIAPPTTAWVLGPLWSNSTICAKSGTYGLQRTGDGVHGDSIVSTDPIPVRPGNMLFASVYVKAGAGADGQIGFGFAFYSSSGALLSSQFVDTTSFPTSWLQLAINVTIPNFAVIAIPIIRAVNHFIGIWCVDTALVSRSSGQQHWELSSLKHYYSDYVPSRS